MDIDIDLASSRRPLIFKKIREERGELGLVQVCTYGTESTKSAILAACFVEGTKVKTLKGEKNIQDITSDDYVFTSNGWEQVIAPTKLNWKNNFISITGNYGFEDEIVCTDNHEFLILPRTNEHRLDGKINHSIINDLIPEYKTFSNSKKAKYRNYIRDVEPIWIEAKDLKENDYLLSKIDYETKDILYYYLDFSKSNKNSNFIKPCIEIDNNFCELLGIWLAEGSFNRNAFSFTISSAETKLENRILFLMEEVFGLKNPYINYRDNNSIVIQYTSATLRDFLYSLFKINSYSEINQYNKWIPKELLYIDPLKQLQIFKGWIMGDGTYRQRTKQKWSGSKELKGTTVSRQLCLDMKHILHRNFLNPSIIREKRNNKAEVYNLILSGKVAEKIGYIKNGDYETILNIDWDDRLGKDLPCVYNGELYMRYQIRTKKTIFNNDNKEVYCLMVHSQNFSVSDIIVHNCRGYRSKEYPEGIDVDIAQYMSSLIPSERGFIWPLSDVINGNEEKGRKPVATFINEVNRYPGLLDIMFRIENLVNKRGVHASGVVFYDDDPYETAAFMRSPAGEIETQYDLHDAEAVGKLYCLITLNH